MMHDLWPSNLLIEDIKEKQIIDDVSSYILENYIFKNITILEDKNNIFDDPFFEKFKNQIVKPAFDNWLKIIFDKTIDDFSDNKLKGWLAPPSKGYNMTYHNHKGSHLTGIFYLLVDNDESGQIVLFDPRSNANRGYKSDYWPKLFEPFVIKPESYKSVIFPSFVYHQVTPFNGNIRLAIPVDLYL